MKRGDVFWANLQPRSGSEQSGRRPVIVISTDGLNRVGTWRSVMVVPCSTSALQASRAPTVAHLPAHACGLAVASVALGHQLTTIDRAKLEQKAGALSESLLAEVERAVKNALDLA